MGEGPGLVRLRRDLVEDQSAGLVDGDAALDEVVGKAALQLQLVGEAVDRGAALALLRTSLADQRVDLPVSATAQRPKHKNRCHNNCARLAANMSESTTCSAQARSRQRHSLTPT